jgi:hypothetical protein
MGTISNCEVFESIATFHIPHCNRFGCRDCNWLFPDVSGSTGDDEFEPEEHPKENMRRMIVATNKVEDRVTLWCIFVSGGGNNNNLIL